MEDGYKARSFLSPNCLVQNSDEHKTDYNGVYWDGHK